MAYCAKCGAYVADDAKFCPSCGQAPASEQQSYQQNYQQPHQQTYQTFKDPDIEDNKVLAAFSYLNILVLIPLVARPDSEFVKFHINQGLCLIVFMVLCGLCGIVPFLGWFVAGVGSVFALVCLIIGVVRALKGVQKPLPLVGKYTIYK